jgi:Holliday junction resolvase RusA-like endonuclease
MTFVVTFTIDGPPHGKGRPRFRRFGNFVSTYTDAKTKSYETLVKEAATKAMGSSPPLDGPVRLDCIVRLPVPKSYPKKRSEACLNGSEWPTKKPDWDNVAKSVADAMNDIVFVDDTQIVIARIVKIYAAEAGVDVKVTEVLDGYSLY